MNIICVCDTLNLHVNYYDGIFICRMRHLYSEIQFIQDFAGSTSLQSEYGSLFSKLKDSYYQLEDLS